ncbi:hypothetical protein H257_07121 [Aphanomyces astaci]|uniref:Uncharacterized protein n=1 Tax=Aphanomyces astaci TaxID=112090 RepID=W4GLZ2_APHAT|nr:hypothetical protein H257_07121 [Aphanomyces astaci]ETV79918.1 hypothetical protein H257_07121 [Aphanomyces astaci]|eukprot:XP_009830854.1 hypothetical protein H257_07121 [Aphanomyces astaci]
MVDLLGWPFGLLLSFIASIVGVLGKIMIKLSFRPSVALESSEATCWWGGGMALIVVVNPALCISAYKFAPQSLLAPMGGLCVVWNTVLSPYILNETLRTRDMIGATIIFLGCVVVGGVGSHQTHDIPINELASHFTSAPFLVYITTYIVVLMILLRCASPAFFQAWGYHHRRRDDEISDDPNVIFKSTCCRVSLASMAGSISGQLYCMCALLRLTHNDPREVFTTPLVYVVGLAALGFAMSGLYLMNMALHLYDALFVIYIYEATLLMGGAISGICFFGDMKDLSGWHWGVYSAGIAFILVGIVVLSTGDRPLSLSEGDHHQYNDDLHAVKQTLL